MNQQKKTLLRDCQKDLATILFSWHRIFLKKNYQKNFAVLLSLETKCQDTQTSLSKIVMVKILLPTFLEKQFVTHFNYRA
ncbi:MAG: hypothetical protein EBT95_00575 [Verrucomicrobia bacterium]|nr:hypothetical protein [Verrucomicrobiota bacterium]